MRFELGVGAISVKWCSEVEAELKPRWSMLHSWMLRVWQLSS